MVYTRKFKHPKEELLAEGNRFPNLYGKPI